MTGRIGVSWTAAAIRGLLALTVFGVLALIYRAATGRTDRPSPWWILAATIAVAVLLWLWQTPIDRLANRVVHRRRADAEATMDALLRGMTETLPVDEVVIRLAEAAGRNRQRAEVRVWLADGSSWGRAWTATPDAGSGSTYRVDVRHGEDRVGEIAVAAGARGLTPFDRRLLDDLAGPAGVALSTVRLSVDLRRREEELMALGELLAESTERIRLAGAEQRRRLRAEVNRQVMPHLVSAMDELATDVPDPATIRQQASTALDELRTLARGVHPPRLAEDGLVSSLDGWMERHDRNVSITGAIDRSLPDEVLRVAYFCVVTLLGTLDAAEAQDLTLALDDDAARLALRVGGRLTRAGMLDPDAVQLARDRLEAFDGTLATSESEQTWAFIAQLPLNPDAGRLP